MAWPSFANNWRLPQCALGMGPSGLNPQTVTALGCTYTETSKYRSVRLVICVGSAYVIGNAGKKE